MTAHNLQVLTLTWFITIVGSEVSMTPRADPGGNGLEDGRNVTRFLRSARSGGGLAGGTSIAAAGSLEQLTRPLKSKPYFDVTLLDEDTGYGARNVTSVEGGKAALVCTVKNLGPNSTVSWIRKARPPVVLSYGRTTFTSDRRFRIEGPSGDRPHSWLLHVDPVLAKDQGLYECQVNTRGKLSLVFKLNVAPAQAQLFGKSAVYVKEGSTISLTCAINLFSVPPPDITWMHGSNVMNFESPRGGISLEIEKTRTGTTSKLLVTKARMTDSGAYTCNPSRGQPVTADVHIITGENPAELQDGQTSSAGLTPSTVTTLMISLLLALHATHT